MEKFQLSIYDNCGEIESFSICGEISVQLMGFYCNFCRVVAESVIHAVLQQKFLPQFTRFQVEKKLSPKVHLWRKNDNYEVCLEVIINPVPGG